MNLNLANFAAYGLLPTQAPADVTTQIAEIKDRINQTPADIENILNQGGKWNDRGQLVGSDGTVYDYLPNRGDYEYQKGTEITGYYPNGVAYIRIDGKDYPVYNAPKANQAVDPEDPSKAGNTTKEPPTDRLTESSEYLLGFGEGLKNKADAIPEFMKKSSPKQLDAFFARIPSQLQSAWDEGLENTVVNVGGKAYQVTLESWRERYNKIQTITNLEEKGRQSSELLVDVVSTFFAVRAAGKTFSSLVELTEGATQGASSAFNNGGVLDNANFAQKKFNAAGKFSDGGIEYWEKTLGRRIETMDELKSLIKSGEVKVSQVPIDYIVRDGNTLILNTRSSQVLTELGIPRSQWNAVNRTGQDLYETNLTNQLARNKLTSEGVPNVVQSGK